jgi:hypothetical protein
MISCALAQPFAFGEAGHLGVRGPRQKPVAHLWHVRARFSRRGREFALLLRSAAEVLPVAHTVVLRQLLHIGRGHGEERLRLRHRDIKDVASEFAQCQVGGQMSGKMVK